MFAYYALLVRSYGVGDMSVVYPLARGLAPVLTTIAAFLAIGEALSTGQVVAVAMISLGIMALSFGAGASRAAVGFALATGVSRRDLQLLRRAGRAHCRHGAGLPGLPGDRHRRSACSAMALSRGAPTSSIYVRRHGAIGLAGRRGVGGWASSPIWWRRTSLPLGPVTALRETSVIFGAVMGTLVLKEGFGPAPHRGRDAGDASGSCFSPCCAEVVCCHVAARSRSRAACACR